MLTLIAQAILLLAVGWAVHRFLSKSDLDNVPGPAAQSFFKGNLAQLFDSEHGWDFNDMITQKFGRVVKVYGLFGSKYLHIYDPKALHHILVKDQGIYEETTAFFVFNNIVFGGGLTSTQGEQHRKQRKMLNPVFSIAHMRHMIPMFNDVAKKLEKTIKLQLANGTQEIDILHWMSRAALEMIGQSGLGYSFDPLVEGAKPHPFSEAAKAFIPAVTGTFLEQEYILPTLVKFSTPQFRRWALDLLPFERYHKIRNIVDTWDQTTTEIFEGKKKAFREGDEALVKQVGRAKDLMSILMKANMEASEEDRLSDREVLAQMSTFAFAATDTTSNALSRTLHLLATHPKAQERLRQEITEALKSHNGDIPYDDLVALPFMDAVCRETLRVHAPVPKVIRVARHDTVLPLSAPIKGVDGREMDSILVPKDTKIFISLLNANTDPALWGPDSLEWKPERWLSPLPEAVHEAHMPGIYSHLMTFLGGGRACIGFKFSQLEMKVVLSTLVSRFHLFPPKKEIVWQMSGITTPALKESPSFSQLPLRMEVVKSEVGA